MENSIQNLISRFSELEFLQNVIEKVVELIIQAHKNNNKILLCGNGGSTADCEHLAGELVKNFEIHRKLEKETKSKLISISEERGVELAEKLQQGISVISLCSNSALISAISNDIGADFIFAQQIAAIANKNDVVIGFSTSGNSQNIVDALITAKAKGAVTVGFTGNSGGQLKNYADVLIHVPKDKTADIQELHLPIYHTICREVEYRVFG